MEQLNCQLRLRGHLLGVCDESDQNGLNPVSKKACSFCSTCTFQSKLALRCIPRKQHMQQTPILQSLSHTGNVCQVLKLGHTQLRLLRQLRGFDMQV